MYLTNTVIPYFRHQAISTCLHIWANAAYAGGASPNAANLSLPVFGDFNRARDRAGKFTVIYYYPDIYILRI
jgi:hypothetical protein